MELRHLRYLVAVAEDLSFRRAAERLHVSHAALRGCLKSPANAKFTERGISPANSKFTECGTSFIPAGLDQ